MEDHIDSTLEDADWIKMTWDLPPYKSPAFMSLGIDLEKFRKLPVYAEAVRAGLIRNDRWVPAVVL